MPLIYGSTYPVSRYMLENYLTQQGSIPLGMDETDNKEVYSIFEKDEDSIAIYLQVHTIDQLFVLS